MSNKFHKEDFDAIESPIERFRQLMILIEWYETDDNAQVVEELQAEIDRAKKGLLDAGFAEDSPIVQGAIKGLIASQSKAQKQIADNLPELAEYFGVKLSRVKRSSGNASTGELAMYRPNLSEIKQSDWIFKQAGKTAVVVHSSTVDTATLDKLAVKADSQTWLALEYNGDLQYTRNKTGEANPQMVGQITNMPENYAHAHSVVYTGESLSGFMGTVAQSLGLKYSGNGWQSNTKLAEQFKGVSRVEKIENPQPAKKLPKPNK